MPAVQETVERVRRIDVDQYRYGFETLIESDKAPKGLSEETVKFISEKKNEPAWMLQWRLEAYRRWLTMTEPTWARVNYPRIDYQDLYYYSAPKPKKQIGSLDEIDPEILKTYEKLGIPLREVEVLEGVVRPDYDGSWQRRQPLFRRWRACHRRLVLHPGPCRGCRREYLCGRLPKSPHPQDIGWNHHHRGRKRSRWIRRRR